MTAADVRDNAYVDADCEEFPTGRNVSFGGTKALAGILMRVETYDGSTLKDVFWSRTNNLGFYSITWDTPFQTGMKVVVRVYPEMPAIPVGLVEKNRKPTYEFRIGDGNVSLSSKTYFPTSANQNSTQNFSFGASEHLSAYLTMREIYMMYSQSISGVRLLMQQLSILVNDAFFHVAADASTVRLTAGVATQEPDNLAHETGHIVNWRGWGDIVAPVAPLVDYSYNPSDEACADSNSGGWLPLSCEYEKIAFIEGFADFHRSMYMWKTDAAPPAAECAGSLPHPRIESGGGQAFDIEGSCGGSSLHLRNKPVCTTRALWDVVDNPPGDDDSVSVAFSTVVAVLQAYPRTCTCIDSNRCANEADPYDPIAQPCGTYDMNGANFKDFRVNFLAATGISLRSIENDNELSDQDNN